MFGLKNKKEKSIRDGNIKGKVPGLSQKTISRLIGFETPLIVLELSDRSLSFADA